MPLSSEDIAHVRRGWAMAAAGGEIVGNLFYNRLFAMAPEVRGLFADNMDAQAAKLLQTLNWIVDNLDDGAALRPQAAALAVRHVRYGVSAEHYLLVGAALVETLREALGPAFTQADGEAWARVYGTLSAAMIEAAYGSPATAQ